MPSGGSSYFDPSMTVLPGGKPAGVGSIGTLPTGGAPRMSALDSGGGGFQNFLDMGGGDLIGGGVSLLTGLFADNPAKRTATDITGDLRTLASSLTEQGKKTTSTGLDALAPVIKYLNGLLSGNPADVLAATQPERASILDQYDTARKTLERTAPRGGGQVSAMGDLEAKQASQLATTTATARASAADRESQLGTALTGQGLSAQAYAGNDLATALQGAERQAEQQAQSNKDAGASIGGLIATALPFLAFL